MSTKSVSAVPFLLLSLLLLGGAAGCRRAGPDDPETLSKRFNAACALSARGQYAQAETEFRAVFNLQEHVLGSEHPSTLATRHNLAASNPHFTGRAELLERLERALTSGPVALTALHGLGGIGKSQTALEYAWRHLADFELVWWLRAESVEGLLGGLGGLAVELGAVAPEETNAETRARAALAFLLQSGKVESSRLFLKERQADARRDGSRVYLQFR